ncbi:uncharacterized protein (DUF2267 family) [Spinactinospora alkalitolerans]|uniref:Uncharacterized protein (DUF2267 family) n=1 Tax=Spinactinospora alkalitolerans TaxID=687207 RepID=A0A852TWD3_9ACTN|nr:DUF2267 domain-containing protein [Spinactinospora alkalitolerans]NYE48238.1 uncharacterized protein (DUF2267 family) [Spinactinospora alkalitolerans]
MQHDEFIGKVQNQADLANRGEAEQATRVTLETLAEHLPDGLARNLAGQLPTEIGEHLERASGSGSGEAGAERFGLREFVDRVGERAGVQRAGAEQSVRAVCAVVGEAVNEPELEKVRGVLPDDLRSLLPRQR